VIGERRNARDVLEAEHAERCFFTAHHDRHPAIFLQQAPHLGQRHVGRHRLRPAPRDGGERRVQTHATGQGDQVVAGERADRLDPVRDQEVRLRRA
jgi:hypothetical protein